jgi:dTDP-4-amino-4,6-dideoxygalactose transaminase
VLSVGATPVFVDVDPDTYALDMVQAARVVTPRTKAIIPVHLYGHPANMDAVNALAQAHDLKVIEDNAQAFGATWRGHKTGALGHIACLSFFPTKNLGAYGDAGMVVTDDPTLAERVTMLRTHGWKKKYYTEMLGYNSRLDTMQAAILRVKLRHVDTWNAQRRELAAQYSERLAPLGIGIPVVRGPAEHVYHQYVVRLDDRDRVQAQLKVAGIASEVYYPIPPHLTTPCRKLGYKEGDFPVAEQAARETLALPFYPELTLDQVDSVVAALRAAL